MNGLSSQEGCQALNSDELLKRLRDKIVGSVEARLEAIEALQSLDHSALETLVKVLGNSTDPILAWTAAEVLGNLGDPVAVDPLLNALSRGDSVLRKKAAVALGQLDAMRAVEPLIHALDDADGEVRDAAAWALLEIGKPQAVQSIVWAGVRGNINLDVLAELNEDALNPLLAYLASTDPEVRAGAATALGALHKLSAVEPLILVLQRDPSDIVRSSAAFALGELEDRQSFETLVTALRDPFERVRGHAARALGLLKSDGALGPLGEAARDESEFVRTWAKWAEDWIRSTSQIDR
jgi:HEAT repeat protein